MFPSRASSRCTPQDEYFRSMENIQLQLPLFVSEELAFFDVDRSDSASFRYYFRCRRLWQGSGMSNNSSCLMTRSNSEHTHEIRGTASKISTKSHRKNTLLAELNYASFLHFTTITPRRRPPLVARELLRRDANRRMATISRYLIGNRLAKNIKRVIYTFNLPAKSHPLKATHHFAFCGI